MDYLARLIAGASNANKQKPNTAAERLTLCIKLCNSLRNLWQRGNVGHEDDAASARAVELLDRLNNVLVDESRKAAPHSCLLHIITNQIYIILAKLALESQHPQVVKGVSQIFHNLINGEADGLLDNKLFSRSLLDLVKYTVLGPRVVVDEATESDLIELLFEICTKIRLDPDILPAWFHPERDQSRMRRGYGDARKNQFPLFYVLVEYVHNDGAMGDFARTGLLYLTETASRAKQLETWMIESDLAPQMASGLGALYSRLSRHFPPLEDTEKALPVLGLSDESNQGRALTETRESFQYNIKEFLSYLAFWQDTLNHCRSSEVTDTLLDHFQVLFVQQLLYPSLLESSDVDGGSTAAVIAHLTRILTALDNQILAQRMLGYLLASTSQPAKLPIKPKPRLSMSRRKSLDHLAALAEAAQSPSPDLFTLLDLIIISLKSRHSNTVNTCLKLLSTILSRHHPTALSALFRTESLDENAVDTSVKTFNATLVRYFDMASEMAPAESMDDSYQDTITDTKIRLERHSCSLDPNGPLLHSRVKIAFDCKLMEPLLNKLTTFFANDTLTNLLLTEALIGIAACENISIYGWLLPLSAEGQSAKTVTSVLRKLTEQIRSWRSWFPEWNDLVARRRQELVAEPVPGTDFRSASGQSRTSDVEKSTSSRDIPSTPPRTPTGSRPITPTTATRGRPISPAPQFGSIDGALSSSSNLRTNATPRPLAGSPLRKAYMPTDSSPIQAPRSISQSTAKSEDDREILLKTVITLEFDDEVVGQKPLSTLANRLTSFESPSSSPVPTRMLGGDSSGAATPSQAAQEEEPGKKQVSLSHVLTNTVILQEFVLEVAAVVQVRGTMFQEVDLGMPAESIP